MAFVVNCEDKPLRKQRLGPPDVYPQDPKQKEDELTAVSVKQGFNASPITSDEYGSVRNLNIVDGQMLGNFAAILSKKYEINTLPETAKKKQQISHRDNYWPVPTRPKAAELWLKDLVGNKPLTVLAKKVPIFNKKDEIISKLCDYAVPTTRACWFVKMSSAYYVAISETKNKSKRQLPDQTQEWTQTLQRFLKEQLARLEEHYSWTPQPAAAYPSMTGGSSEEQKVAARQWQYGTQLAGVMYEEGLLERELFLEWVLDVFRARPHDCGLLKLVVPLLLQYVEEFTRSELLARKLAYYVCKKINFMVCEMDAWGGRSQSPVCGQSGAEAAPPPAPPIHSNPLIAAFIRLVNCNFYQSIIYGLSSVLQMILYHNPTALVWNNLGDGKAAPASGSPLGGSPLDLLPCLPSGLPLPPSASNAAWRRKLRRIEDDVLERSRAADTRWSVQTSVEVTVGRVLATLDALDQHKWHRSDDANNFETLYARVFPAGAPGADGTSEAPPPDDAIVQLLCEWAVSPHRLGEHRAPAVAMLLEKRQSELMAAADADADDRDSVCSASFPAYIYQPLLFRFLDTSAPVLESVGLGGRSRAPFAALVLLFLELTRHDVFSHDQYLRTLISRGELRTNPAGAAQSAAAYGRAEHDDDDKLDIDDDLDKLVKHIKSTNADMDNPDSPKEGFAALGGVHQAEKAEARRHNRHLIYTTHFPLPQEDAYTDDDKQRHILLFGVKKARDEARHTVKKMSKEIMKLFSKKLSIDVSEGGKVKRQSRGEFPFEAVVLRFQTLSFYDQHHVTHQCVQQVVEMLSAFAGGAAAYLPVVEHVSFLFDLMELAINIRDLLDGCVLMLRELPDVEGQLHSKNSPRAGSYATALALHIVGACRRYHSTLILSQDQTAAIFEGMCKVVKHVRNHMDCSSAERCVLAYLVHLYSCCSFLKSKHYEPRFENFSNAYLKLKQFFNTSLKPSGSCFSRNAGFLAEHLASPGRPLEASAVRALNESPGNRYSFVCNVLIQVCNSADGEQLSDLAVLAAEATARCNALSAEWLGVLEGICGGPDSWLEVVTAIDKTAPATHRSLSLFLTVLAARHCIYMDDVIQLCAHCLMIACRQGDGDREPGARLVLRLLGYLWIPSEQPQPTWYGTTPPAAAAVPSAGQPCCLKYSCDRHLLLSAQHNIQVPALLCALKAIIILADATIGDNTAGWAESKTPGELSISAILGTSDHGDLQHSRSGGGATKVGLSDFARHMLQQICAQPWVREKFLSSPDEIVSMERPNSADADDSPDLLERVLSARQARRLFHMIVHPETYTYYTEEQDAARVCARILETLDQWTMRVALLDLRLLYRQTAKQSADELSRWLSALASACVAAFQPGAASAPPPPPPPPSAAGLGGDEKPSFVWLIPPLVAKLPMEAQARILQSAIQLLESASWSRRGQAQQMVTSAVPPPGGGGPPAAPARQCPAAAAYQPFKQLVLACVRGQEEQRDELVSSLQLQFQQFLSRDNKDENKDKEEKRKENHKRESVWPDEHKTGAAVLQALQLRFSLLGGVFDALQRSNLSTSDAWVLQLAQLVTNGVVTLYNNSELYTTVVDMMATLIHSAVVGDSQAEKPEENKRHYHTLAKKLRKELGDRRGVSIKYLRQFLPIPKKTVEVINCELKSAPLPGFESFEKRRGLILVDKQKVSPWDLLEGHRNPAPLSWAWFGALRLERSISKYQEIFKMLRLHRHGQLVKTSQYYLEPPPLPPEELEPVAAEKQKEETKAVEVASCDSPRTAKRGRAAPARKKRERPARSLSNSGVMAPRMSTPPMQGLAGYPAGGMYGGEAQQWAFPQQTGPQQPGPGPYYQQQAMPPGGAGQRFQTSSSKQAISQMLRNRQPGGFLGPAGGPGAPPAGYAALAHLPPQTAADKQHLQMRQQHLLRDQIRVQPGGAAAGSMYAARQMQPGMPPQQMYPAGMGQTYSPAYLSQQGAPPGPMMGQTNANPMAFGGQQPGVPAGGQQPQPQPQQPQQQQQQQQAMLGMRGQQSAGYMPQMRPTGTYMQAPNVTVNQLSGGQYRGMAGGPGPAPAGAAGPPAGLQQRLRHPMMMQQQPSLLNQLRQPSLAPQQAPPHNPYQYHHP